MTWQRPEKHKIFYDTGTTHQRGGRNLQEYEVRDF
jgi:hypothetical protein